MKKYLLTIMILLTATLYNYGQNINKADTLNQSDEPIFITLEELPTFPGGDKALQKFIYENTKYPKSAIEEKISGTVYVQFIVEKDGSISDIKVVRGIGGGCDEEAVRVVKLMPNWIPGKQKGVPERVYFMIPITFNLK